MVQGTLRVKVGKDGKLVVDASQLRGSTAEIEEYLKKLAVKAGGTPDALVIEQHIGGNHTHEYDGQTVTHSH